MSGEELCPCGGMGRARFYSDCCGQLHQGLKTASSPEQLMRSRYSAFVKEHADYLVQTLHEDKRLNNSSDALKKSFSHTEWHSLKIVESTAIKNHRGEVEFVAFYTDANSSNKTLEQLHERSRFIFENNAWYYVDGDHLPPIKLGRNDPCWCGSGKKLKKCHA